MYLICDLCKKPLEKPKLNFNGHGYNACLSCQRKKRLKYQRRYMKNKKLSTGDVD